MITLFSISINVFCQDSNFGVLLWDYTRCVHAGLVCAIDWATNHHKAAKPSAKHYASPLKCMFMEQIWPEKRSILIKKQKLNTFIENLVAFGLLIWSGVLVGLLLYCKSLETGQNIANMGEIHVSAAAWDSQNGAVYVSKTNLGIPHWIICYCGVVWSICDACCAFGAVWCNWITRIV